MKVPISWLKEYVEFDAAPAELADRLTFSGTETESMDVIGAGLEAVVVGEILDVKQHPDADGLRVCTVDDGEAGHTVVCGAENFRAGDKGAFAPVGAALPDGTKIEKSEIKGVLSEGMLCAEDELGLSDDHSGIMLFDSDTANGTALPDLLGPPETVLTLEVTWNRGDCLSIMGIAREVAALFGTKLIRPSVEYEETGGPVEEDVEVSIEDEACCPRYTARVLSDVKIGPSPMWMRRRLSLCGVRPICNVVDITNYVLLETGHPLHAFDHTLLTDGRIIVRRARSGEKMVTLDEVTRDLTPDMLVIADTKRAVALAGVMGGAGSEIRDDTSKVLLEAASFDPACTRNTVSVTGLMTESSHRFERGVDTRAVDWASRRAAALMVEHAGAVASRGVVDVFPGEPPERKVRCRYGHARGLLGTDVSDEEIASILESLEIPVVDRDDEGCTVSVPSFRRDIEIEADLVEEVARMHGLDRVPPATPFAGVVPDADDSVTRAVMMCRGNLVGLGLNEIVNYSFLSAAVLDLFCSGDAESRVVLPNPVSADYAVMRNSLVPQMVATLGHNAARQVGAAAFFEIGDVFLKERDGSIREEGRLCIGLMGDAGCVSGGAAGSTSAETVFLRTKGILEAVFGAQHVAGGEGKLLPGMRTKPVDHAYFEPERGVTIMAGSGPCGVLGLVKGSICSEWRLGPVAVAEIAVEPLTADAFRAPVLRDIPAYPSVARDMALVVDEAISHENIVAIVEKSAPEELTGMNLFDIFRGSGIARGKKSLAYSLAYRSLTRTLTDEDANRYHEAVKDVLKSKLDVEIREG